MSCFFDLGHYGKEKRSIVLFQPFLAHDDSGLGSILAEPLYFLFI